MKLTMTCLSLLLMLFGTSSYAFDKGGQLQLIENRGQVTDQHGNVRHDIDLKAEQGGVTLYVGSGEMHYQWIAEQSQKSKVKSQNSEVNSKFQIPNSTHKSQIRNSKFQDGFSSAEPGEVIIYRMDVELVGANKGAEAVFEEETGYYENYYLAHTGEDGVQAKGYNRVTYKNVYPGIDWVVYVAKSKVKSQNPTGKSQELNSKFQIPNSKVDEGAYSSAEVLKYDFIVHEGGNVADIRLRYKGATELKMEDGALIATTPFGTITEAVPYSYEAATGKEVNSSYRLQGNELSFNTSSYEGELVIDPTLNWCTYYIGFNNNNTGFAIRSTTADTGGNAYLYGPTSLQNIATNGIHQQVFAGVFDMYIVKFGINGNRVWATYYGGAGDDFVDPAIKNVIATDYAGNIYVCGSTTSTSGISTPSTAHQPAADPSISAANRDGFLAKFNANGQRVWGTYYSDTLNDEISGIDVDSAGNILVLGVVNSWRQSTLVTSGTYKSTGSSGQYIAKFTTTGQRLWGSFVHPGCAAAVFDRQGNIYLGGAVSVIDTLGLSTAGTHKPVMYGNANFETYIVKMSSNGQQKLWGTYYGGMGNDYLSHIVCGDNDHVYIVGRTLSDTGISTAGAHKLSRTANNDGYIARFSSTGQRLWGSYVNGSTLVSSYNCVDISRDNTTIVAAGSFNVFSGNIAGKGAFQPTPADASDAFVHAYDTVGNKIWGSYLGGTAASTGYEDIKSINIVDSKDILYVGGRTGSTTGLVTGGAYQTVFDVNYNEATFLAQIGLYDTLVHIRNSFADTVICTGDTMHVPYGVTRNFATNNVFRVQLSNSSGSFASPTNIATINGNTAGTVACYLPFSIPAGNSYRIRVTATNPIDTSELNLTDIKIHEGVAGFNTTINKTTLCSNDTLRMSASATTTGVGYAWNGPASFSSGSANVVLPRPAVSASGAYYITVSKGICNVKDTLNVTVNQAPENVMASSNTPVCTGDTLKLSASSSTGGVAYNWSPGGYNTQQVSIPNTTTLHGGVYTVTATLGSCKDSASTTVSIQQSAIINVVSLTATTLCAGDTAQFYGFPNNAGVNPALQWQVNGVDIPGATNPLFVSTALQNGDKVRMNATPNTTCPGTRSSNEIAVTINPLKAPQVTMSASAGPSLFPNEPITFTAVATDAGNNPEYQWLRNNQAVGGATGATWGANANFLSDGDDICVRVKSNYECASPETATSNCIKLNIRVSVQNIGELSGVNVYPNPVSSQLTVETPLQLSPKGRGYDVVLYDVVGRVVVVPQVSSGSKIFLNMSAVPAGNYVLQVMSDDGGRGYYKIQKGNPQ